MGMIVLDPGYCLSFSLQNWATKYLNIYQVQI